MEKKQIRKFSPEETRFLINFFAVVKKLSKSEVNTIIPALQGYINKEIAKFNFVAEKTVKFHLGNAFKKLGIERRQQIVWLLPLKDFLEVHNKDENINQNNPPEELNVPNKLPVGSQKELNINDIKEIAERNENELPKGNKPQEHTCSMVFAC